MANIFHNDTKSLPKRDEQIVRVDMEQNEIGGRKSHRENHRPGASPDLAIGHVPNGGSKK